MNFIKNSELWKDLSEYYYLMPSPFIPKHHIKIHWVKEEENKKIKRKQLTVKLNNYVGKIFQGNLIITNITEDTIEAYAKNVIRSFYGPYSSPQVILIKYNNTFSEILHSIKQRDVNIQGIFRSLEENNIILDLTEIKSNPSPLCFIATACYENYDAPEVIVLRKYRDEILLQSFYGKIFVNIYYKISPFIAIRISKSKFIKDIIKKYLLDRIVIKLQKSNRI